MKLNVPGTLVLYLAWMGLTCGVLLAGIGGLLPFGLGAIGPDAAFLGLVEAELFFVMVVWPFFMPRLILPEALAASRKVGPGGESHLLYLQVLVMLVVALPLALVSRNLAEIDSSVFIRAHLLVAAVAGFVTVLLSRPSAARLRPWYFLGFFVFAALVPLAAFLGGELGPGRMNLLAAVSPFWAAAQLRTDAALSWAPGVQAAVFGVLALALLASGFLRRPVDSPAPPQ